MATHTAGLHSRGESLRTWCGVLFALFAFLFIRLIFGGFSAHQSIAQAVAREGAIWAAAAALVLFILRVEKLPLTSVGIGGSPWRKPLLWSSVLSGICGAVAVAIIAATKYHGGPGSAAIERFPLWLVTLIVIRAGFVEELFYRGYAIERLQTLGMPRLISAGIPLAIFSLMHLSGGQVGVLLAFALGGILTAFYLWRHDLVANILAHFLVDFIGNVVPRLAK